MIVGKKSFRNNEFLTLDSAMNVLKMNSFFGFMIADVPRKIIHVWKHCTKHDDYNDKLCW